MFNPTDKCKYFHFPRTQKETNLFKKKKKKKKKQYKIKYLQHCHGTASGSLLLLSCSPTPQKHARGWTADSHLSLDMNESVNNGCVFVHAD